MSIKMEGKNSGRDERMLKTEGKRSREVIKGTRRKEERIKTEKQRED